MSHESSFPLVFHWSIYIFFCFKTVSIMCCSVGLTLWTILSKLYRHATHYRGQHLKIRIFPSVRWFDHCLRVCPTKTWGKNRFRTSKTLQVCQVSGVSRFIPSMPPFHICSPVARRSTCQDRNETPVCLVQTRKGHVPALIAARREPGRTAVAFTKLAQGLVPFFSWSYIHIMHVYI